MRRLFEEGLTLDPQNLLLAGSLALYPLLVLALDWGYLAAPLAAGAMLALASLAGSRPLCPVKAGVLHGVLGIVVLLIIGGLPLNSLAGAMAAVVYYGSTPSAISGALLLVVWRLQGLRLAQ